MRFDGEGIARATGGTLHGQAPAGRITTDTRALRPGDWFVALVGPRFDGHAFVEQAVGAGAVGVVVQRPVAGAPASVEVPDTTRALQDLGRAARDRVRGPVVGVAGSAGKTTTRALVACALAQLGRVHQTEANLNNHLGVPLTLLAADETDGAVVVELGTSAPGELALLCDVARPDVRLVVNVGPEHLEFFGDLAGVADEERTLLATARPGDLCLVNADDPWLRHARPPGRVVRWGFEPSADVRVADVRIDVDAWATHAVLHTPDGAVPFTVPAPGRHLAHNAAAALAVAWGLGLDVARAAADLGAFAPVGRRLRPVPLPGGVIAIDDAYNANPPSVLASLEVLAASPGRRVAVLGDMLELGADEARHHADVVAAADAAGLDLLVLVGPRMGAAAAAATRTEAWTAADGTALAARLAAWLAPGDRVLFKGSRGARVERVLEAVAAAREGS